MGVNWVRFAHLGHGMPRAYGKLGSFRIIGKNPEVSPGAPGQNSGEGRSPLARVLSDGGEWFIFSSFLRCCIVLKYATYYTTEQVKSQVFIGRKGDLAGDFTDFHGFFGEGRFAHRGGGNKVAYPDRKVIIIRHHLI